MDFFFFFPERAWIQPKLVLCMLDSMQKLSYVSGGSEGGEGVAVSGWKWTRQMFFFLDPCSGSIHLPVQVRIIEKG